MKFFHETVPLNLRCRVERADSFLRILSILGEISTLGENSQRNVAHLENSENLQWLAEQSKCAKLYGHSGWIIVKRVGNSAHEYRVSFPWIFHFPSRKFIQDFGGYFYCSNEFSFYFLDCTFGANNQDVVSTEWVFTTSEKKWFTKCPVKDLGWYEEFYTLTLLLHYCVSFGPKKVENTEHRNACT